MDKLIDKKMKKNLAAQLILQGAKYLLPLFVMMVLTRFLGPETYGFRSYVLSVMTTLQVILDFGYQSSATKSVVKYGDDAESLSQIVGEVILGKITLLMVVVPILTFMICFIPMLQTNILFVVLSFGVVFLNSLIPDFVFMGKEDMGILTTRYIVSKIIYLLSLFIALKINNSLFVVVALDFLTSLMAFLWTWFTMRKKFHVHFLWASLRDGFKSLKASAYYFLSLAATTMMSSFTTVLIGIGISNPVQIAWWSMANTVISAVQSLFSPINNVLYPRVISTGNANIVNRFAIIGTPIMLLGNFAVVIFAKLIFYILGGRDYLEGAVVLRLLSPLILFGFYAMLFGWPVLGALGKVKELTFITGFASAFHVVVLTVLLKLNLFTIYSVSIVRCMTEVLLCSGRVLGSMRLLYAKRRESKND